MVPVLRLRPVLRGLALGGALLAVAGCPIFGGNDDETNDANKDAANYRERTVEQIYADGWRAIGAGAWDLCAAQFNEVDRQHPYSVWARRAMLISAFCSYQANSYTSAIATADQYISLHPGSPDAAYAQYLIASSNYDQIPDVTRDQTRTEKAMAALEEVIRKYPNTEYANSAKQKLEMGRDQLAGKEMTIGRFYLNRKDFPGAINRFKVVVTRYQTTRHVEEALERLTEAYMAMGITNEAQTAAAVLGHNFPDSPWYKDAYTLLQSRGLEPREDRGSYISRAFNGFQRTVGGILGFGSR